MLDDCYPNDADLEMAALQAAGRAASRAHRRMEALRAAGNLAAAAAECHHGSGYPTNSPAAENTHDPRAGQHGFRCTDCGSFFAGRVRNLWDLRELTATAPCEITITR